MNNPQKINTVMYALLVERQMNNFSVPEARDALLNANGIPKNPDKARRLIYRQIVYFENKGWLTSEGTGRNRRYYQTSKFRELTTQPKHRLQQNQLNKLTLQSYAVLDKERKQHLANLEIVLGEIDEYQSIIKRLPELEQTVYPIYERAKTRSTILLRKVDIINNIINIMNQEPPSSV
ncbi:TPA: hypothetical protein ACX6S4_002652 [Photobacterium damselae]